MADKVWSNKKLSEKLYRFHLQEPTVIDDAKQLENLLEAAVDYISLLEATIGASSVVNSEQAKAWKMRISL